MRTELSEVMMNPVRQRVIQYLMVHEKGTVKEIKKKLSDVPDASLYRHIKILADNEVIVVAEENRIRGTVESVYRLNADLFSSLETEDNGLLVQTTLFSLCKSFADYFAGKDADPVRDMLTVSSTTLMLTDEEFMEFLTKMQEMMLSCLSKEPAEGSKPRQITLISAPGGEN